MGISRHSAESLMRNAKSSYAIYIGIDPGTHTGVAVWSRPTHRFLRVESMKAVEAEELVRSVISSAPWTSSVMVVVEDTRKLRLPKRLQSSGRDRGAGSVARDMSRWEEFLTYHGIPFTMAPMSPKEFRTMDDHTFRRKTGWEKRTNEHGRAAGGLVWSR